MNVEKTKDTPSIDFLNTEGKNLPMFTPLKNGFTALKSVKGIKRIYFKGVALCFIAVLILFGLFILLDVTLVGPALIDYRDGYVAGSAWTGYLVVPTYWLVRVFLYILYFYASFKIGMLVMIFWVDLMIERIIRHFRPLDTRFNTRRFTKLLASSARIATVSIVIGSFFFLLSFIPLVGQVVSFIGIAILAGRDIYNPYIMILADEKPELAKQYRYDTKHVFKGGIVQAITYIIPFAGFLLLPMTYLLQVIGYAYYCENKWHEEH